MDDEMTKQLHTLLGMVWRHVKWSNVRQQLFWQLAIDGIPTSARRNTGAGMRHATALRLDICALFILIMSGTVLWRPLWLLRYASALECTFTSQAHMVDAASRADNAAWVGARRNADL